MGEDDPEERAPGSHEFLLSRGDWGKPCCAFTSASLATFPSSGIDGPAARWVSRPAGRFTMTIRIPVAELPSARLSGPTNPVSAALSIPAKPPNSADTTYAAYLCSQVL